MLTAALAAATSMRRSSILGKVSQAVNVKKAGKRLARCAYREDMASFGIIKQGRNQPTNAVVGEQVVVTGLGNLNTNCLLDQPCRNVEIRVFL